MSTVHPVDRGGPRWTVDRRVDRGQRWTVFMRRACPPGGPRWTVDSLCTQASIPSLQASSPLAPSRSLARVRTVHHRLADTVPVPAICDFSQTACDNASSCMSAAAHPRPPLRVMTKSAMLFTEKHLTMGQSVRYVIGTGVGSGMWALFRCMCARAARGGSAVDMPAVGRHAGVVRKKGLGTLGQHDKTY